MTSNSVLKKKEQVKPNHLKPAVEKLLNEGDGSAIQLDRENDFQAKVKKAIEANKLCYNCETGFHYMEQ